MKKISPSIVMVEDITSSVPRTTFLESNLDEAANLILKIKGTIAPLILKKEGIDSYSVIEGHFEYYSAVRAEEIDPMNGETINAYIVESEEELSFYQKQLELFRQRENTVPELSVNKGIVNSKNNKDYVELVNLIKILTKKNNELHEQQDKKFLEINQSLNSIEKTIEKILQGTHREVPQSNFVLDFNDKKISDNQFNLRLKNSGVTGKAAKSLIKARQQRVLESVSEITNITNVGSKTEEKIRKNWS